MQRGEPPSPNLTNLTSNVSNSNSAVDVQVYTYQHIDDKLIIN